jgi:hypothetical protein
VRISNPKLIRLSGVVRGAIIVPGDGELELPGVLQPTIELSSPIDKVVAAGFVGEDSFIASQIFNTSGVQAAQSVIICTFQRGVWSLDLSCDGGFTGTTNVLIASPFDSLVLLDPDALPTALFVLPRISGAVLAWQGLYRFVFQRDGFQLQLNAQARVAADNFFLHANVNARKSI